MTRWVLLRHDTPTGGWHFDWMLERPSGWYADAAGHADSSDRAGLITFRVFDRPDDHSVDHFAAERLPDHRSAYLTYEGPISAGRGSVTRLAQGTCEIIRDDDEFWVHLLTPGMRRLIGSITSGDGAHYTFRAG
jgi:hypothetical protein